jgi:nitroreductase
MPPPGDDDRLAVVEAIAHSRRSNLRMDPERPVADDLVDRLIAMAGTAPNHRRTFPWRFRVLTGEARAALGEALASHLVTAGDPPEKIAKARSKYLRAPTIVVAASRAGDSATMTAENRDAVSAALQTLLLGATAAGLASLWSTGAAVDAAEVREMCGFEPTDRVVGVVYLGWPVGDAPGSERPAPDVVHIGGAPT